MCIASLARNPKAFFAFEVVFSQYSVGKYIRATRSLGLVEKQQQN